MICETNSDITNVFTDILSEVKDMEALLDSLSSGTRDLMGEDSSSRKKVVSKRVLSNEEKRQAAKSSWAKSKTPVVASVGPKITAVTHEEDNLNVLKAETAIRVKQPAYSFGNPSSNCRSDSRIGKNGKNDEIAPGPMSYVVNEDMLSTRKRPQAPSFTKCKRASDPIGDKRIVSPDNKEEETKTCDSNNPYGSAQPSKGVLFGKAPRFSSEEQCRKQMEVAIQNFQREDLDITKAEKYKQPHIPTAIMAPPAQLVKKKQSPQEANVPEVIPPTPVAEKAYEALSNRFRSPAAAIYPAPKPVDKVSLTKHADLGIPGPGYYEVNGEALQHVLKGEGIQKGVKFQPIKQPGEVFDDEKKNMNLIRRKEEERLLNEARGPGVYNTVTPSKVVVPTFKSRSVNNDSDSKLNARLERKRYLEQKAADMRETHDDCRTADDSVVRKRVPTISFGAPGKSTTPSTGRNNDEYSFKADDDAGDKRSERIKLLHDIDKLIEEENLQRDYAVSYSQVEKRTVGMVTMKAEVVARESTNTRLRSKPEALKVLLEKADGIVAQKKFYGPQLPVAWVQDKAALQRTSQQKRRRGSDDDSDSPTEEILELLNDADQRQNEHYQTNGELTEAFLRSSYSGSQFKKKPVVNFQVNAQDSDRTAFHKKVDPDLLDQNFIGPQLQQDWGAKIKQNSHHALDLSKIRGREKVRAHGKGMVEIQEFDDHHIVKDPSNLAPGAYDVMSNVEIAKQSVKGVPFSRQVARQDAAGAFGEKPQSAVTNLAELLQDDDINLNRDYVLDIDYGLAKDQALKKSKKDIVLYRKDRELGDKKEKDDAGLDHLGGSWFQGMFEEVKRKEGKAIEFSRMTARPGADEEGGVDEMEIMEEILGPQEQALDLEVTDWHPNRPGARNGAIFDDPKKYPRFPVSKKDEKPADAPPTPEAKYTLIHERPQFVVNMDRMRGRQDDIDKELESKGIEAMVHGNVDAGVAINLAEDSAKAIAQGKDSIMRRGPTYVDFEKQRGRNYLEDKRETIEVIINQEIGNEGRLYTRAPDDDHFRNKIGQGGRGALDWDKQIGRNDNKFDDYVDEGAGEDVWIFENQELDLEPMKEGTSKYRKIKSAPAWNSRSDRFEADSDVVEAVIGMQVKDGEVLQLVDVDVGVYKPGMHGFGAKASTNKGYNMSNQISRQPATEINLDISQDLGFEEHPELILDPTDETSMRKPKGGTAMKSTVSRFVRSEKEDMLTAEEQEYGRNKNEVLDLRPTDKPLQRHRPSATAMASKQARFPTTANSEEEAVMKSLDVEKEELRLDPDDAAVRRSTNVEGAVAMRQSASRIPTIHEEKILKEEERLSKQVLDINMLDNDQATKNRITGGSAMRSSAERIPSMKDLRVNEEIRKSTQVELQIDPEVRASRVNLGNVSSLANREERSMNKKPNSINSKSGAKPAGGKEDLGIRKSGTRNTIKSNNSSSKNLSNTNDSKIANGKSANKTVPTTSTFSPVNLSVPLPTAKQPDVDSYSVDKLKMQLAELGL